MCVGDSGRTEQSEQNSNKGKVCLSQERLVSFRSFAGVAEASVLSLRVTTAFETQKSKSNLKLGGSTPSHGSTPSPPNPPKARIPLVLQRNASKNVQIKTVL